MRTMQLCGMIAALAVLVSGAQAADEKVDPAKLPKPVTKTLKEKYAKAKPIAAVKFEEGGQTFYEVTITSEKIDLDVTLSDAGVIVMILKPLLAKDLPKAVTGGLQKKYPKAQIKGAQEITELGKVSGYFIEIVPAGKKAVEVRFDPTGKFVEEGAIDDKPVQ